MKKNVLIIGTGLGGLATGLRLSSKGYQVSFIEKYHQPGGRLNQWKKDGFTFDVGPSFFSMSYEFKELFDSCGIKNPLTFHELDPVYSVHFSDKIKPYHIYKNLDQLALEFPEEKDFVTKARKFLQTGASRFHDTEHRIIKQNFNSLADYFMKMASVPLKHLPALYRSMWDDLSKTFDTEEVKIIFSLVGFFLGNTPFDTPAVYSLLNYTELQHDGYWNVKGGMYSIVEEIVKLLKERNASFQFNTEITEVIAQNGAVTAVKDSTGKLYTADIIVCNADAAAFRGKILKRDKYSEPKLDAMEWTLAPFTIYLGVKGNIPNLSHHTYFLGTNFKEYANAIFKSSVKPQKPYYYVNASSKSDPDCAPEGCENLFILCPVPDLRTKPDWSDTEMLADEIISDLGHRVGYDIHANILVKEVWNPLKWRDSFNLYKGSGLGLGHRISQIGAMRPKNKDEEFNNLFYAGASTHPGTGLPIVVIGSKLVTERIEKEYPI